MNDLQGSPVMIARVAEFAHSHGFIQTPDALSFAAAAHDGQLRHGPGSLPYFTHPLNIACRAIALGVMDDDLFAAILLHDVCEDCGYTPQDLPVRPTVREVVRLLSRNFADSPMDYYRGIAGSPNACLIKCLDRLDNMYSMAAAFTFPKMMDYTREARDKILPLIDTARRGRPDLMDAVRQIEFDLTALIVVYENLLSKPRA